MSESTQPDQQGQQASDQQGPQGQQDQQDQQDQQPGVGSAEKDPQTWTTGDEPATGPQRSYLETLAREAGEQVPDDLNKAQASELIDTLQERTGRGSS